MSVADHVLQTITVDRERLGGLYDQWTPQDWVQLNENIACLTFHDPMSGRSAVWYLDADHAYCGSHIEVVQRLTTQDILSCVAPWFDMLSQNALAAQPAPVGSIPAMPLFLAVQLGAAWSVRHLNGLRQIQTSLIERDQGIEALENPGFTARQIRRLLGTRIGPESLVVLSPFTDAPLRSQISFVVDHKLIHRFYDPENGSTFYLAWWESQLNTPPIFYYPRLNVIIGDDGQAPLLPGRILGWYLSHPRHVTAIEQAHHFEARDYGLGHASSLLNDISDAPKSESASNPLSRADIISKSWALLHQPSAELPPAQHIASAPQKKPSGFFGRLRSLIKKK